MNNSTAREVDVKSWAALGKPWRIAIFGDVVLDVRNLLAGIWCPIIFGYKISGFSDRNRNLRYFVPFRSSEKLSAPTEGCVSMEA